MRSAGNDSKNWRDVDIQWIGSAPHKPRGAPASRLEISPADETPALPCFDGSWVPNFNNDFNGDGPDIGAPKSGAAPMQFSADAWR